MAGTRRRNDSPVRRVEKKHQSPTDVFDVRFHSERFPPKMADPEPRLLEGVQGKYTYLHRRGTIGNRRISELSAEIRNGKTVFKVTGKQFDEMKNAIPIFLVIAFVAVSGCTQQDTNISDDFTAEDFIADDAMEEPIDDSVTSGDPPEETAQDEIPVNADPEPEPEILSQDEEQENDNPIEQPQLPEPAEFYFLSDDSGFYLENGTEITEINVAKGQNVKITFFIKKQGTYYGGMTIRGSEFDSGKLEKEETYEIEFTAEESFEIKSYWPQTNKLKATLDVTVSE